MQLLLRRLHLAVIGVVLALVGAACFSEPESAQLFTTAAPPVATTEPVGIPLDPTPTPLALPDVASPPVAVEFPTPMPADEQSASVTPDVAPTAEPSGDAEASGGDAADDPLPAPAEVDPPTDPTPQPAPTASPTPEPTPTPAEPTAAPARAVTETGLAPLGQSSGIALALPVQRIELIGFHEAGHPGSQAINAAGTGVAMITLETRSRGTHERSAADIVVPPGEPVYAPATGTIVAANPYVLYCQHDDQLVYIEPDGYPGWQVRVFHVEGESPPVGTRVVAGETLIAEGARTLPFESQVDEYSAEPSWPHVHVEVVDTSVPDTRPPGPGCP